MGKKKYRTSKHDLPDDEDADVRPAVERDKLLERLRTYHPELDPERTDA